MIVRLHAMYQRSRGMLIFPIVTCLALVVACGVIIVLYNSSFSGGEFWSMMNDFSTQAHGGTIRGPCAVWHLWLHCHEIRLVLEPGGRSLDHRNCIGSPCTVPCSMDCCKTPSWTATKTDRTGRWELFNSFNKIPHVLLCRVSEFECRCLFHWSSSCARLLIASPSAICCLQSSVRRSVTDICVWPFFI